ncbi:FG-GAP repeat domain-containing protein [Aquipuribacter sp. MA13-6]|uniref:FG-GAP repeat domain-containing protein n=1 Tax=unclassified Aquipuribacter TaxID=2635084 RepID=UPI003EEEE78B
MTTRRTARPTRSRLRRAFGAALTVALAGSFLVVSGSASAALPTPRATVTFRSAPEAPSPYQGQIACDPVERPGTQALRALLKTTYGKGNSAGITRSCATGGASEHKDGRAYDWMLNASNATDKAMGDSFVAWLTGRDAGGVVGGNAHRLGVQYVIWNKRTWQSWNGQWKAYTGASPHTDHVHISLSWDGAMKRTSWWTGSTVTQRDHGPCQLYVGEPAPRYAGANYSPCPKPTTRLGGVVAADFDGDGRDDVATFRAGQWVIALSATDRVIRSSYGRAGDIPVAGDWNGNGYAGIGVVRNGRWLLRNASSGGPVHRDFYFSPVGALPVVGDWNGNGTDTPGFFRNGSWAFRRNNDTSSGSTYMTWSKAGHQVVAGDWNRDGIDSVGVWSRGAWALAERTATGTSHRTLRFGPTSGMAVAGDWNGDRWSTAGTATVDTLHFTDNLSGAVPQSVRLPL